jgi:DNA-binding winged helix-turn-helix (wHTH) protein
MQIRFGSFVLDSDTRELRRGRRAVHVSPKAFELLLALAENRPRALSKRQLQERLWPDTLVVEASLANLVGELRAALGETARRPRFVRTVQRFGYALRADSEPAPAASPAPRTPGTIYRIVWSGGRATLAEGEHVVGRDEDATVRLSSASVSRRHAAIRIGASGAVLEDLGSKNGTLHKGRRVTAAVVLADGDEFQLGAVRMRLRILKRSGSTETVARSSQR